MSLQPVRKVILLTSAILGLVCTKVVMAQCPTASGDQISYGSGLWFGYVYNTANDFSSVNYQGYITQSTIFDYSFCGDNCDFITNGCNVNTETFTVRFKAQQSFSNSIYRVTIGGDDGVRLSMDGGSTYLLNGWSLHSYATYSTLAVLNGSYNMVLDYYENNGQNRVSFTYSNLGSAYGGIIGSDQNFCTAGSIDPTAFTSAEPAMFLSGAAPQYQWQQSIDNTTWTDISGATTLTYDLGAGFFGSRFFRRRAFDGGSTYAYSNTVSVTAASPAGDQVTYGSDSWIGYVYDGRDNFTSSNYVGEVFESESFDESFGGSTATFNTSGCSMYAETFSVRYKMRKNFPCGDYRFTIGADDGVRLSIDGGATYLVSDYTDHGYRTVTSGTVSLNGPLDLVLDYFENGGGNRVTYSLTQLTSCPLPVEWLSFSGSEENGNNKLTWQTATEINNDGFVVERAGIALDFDSIGWVVGHGNSSVRNTYAFIDLNPLNGMNYYRIRQVDWDGQIDYSRTIRILYEVDTKMEFSVYPNPATNYVFLSYTPRESLSIEITDVQTGMRVALLQGNPSNKIDLPQLTPGFYFIHIIADGIKSSHKLLIR